MTAWAVNGSENEAYSKQTEHVVHQRYAKKPTRAKQTGKKDQENEVEHCKLSKSALCDTKATRRAVPVQ